MSSSIGPQLHEINSLQIALEPPPDGSNEYVPGDVIKGEIILKNPYHASGIEASVTLTGVARVRFKEKGRFLASESTHECLLINQVQPDLLRTKHSAGLAWPFTFIMPDSVLATMPRRASLTFSESAPFATQPGHPLPPNLSEALNERFVRIKDAETPDKNITIAYFVTGTLRKPHLTHSYTGQTTCHKAFHFAPLRSSEAQENENHTVSTRSQNKPPGYLPGDSSSIKMNSVNVHVSLPRVAIIGHPLKIEVRFDIESVQEAVQDYSFMALERVEVGIFAETRARVPGLVGRDVQAFWISEVFSRQSVGDHMGPQERSILLTESATRCWNLLPVMPELNALAFEAPSFETYNISRSYMLEVRGHLALGQHDTPFDVTSKLIVLPRYTRREVTRVTSSTLPLNHSSRARDNEQKDGAPPSYFPNKADLRASSDAPEADGLPSYDSAMDKKR